MAKFQQQLYVVAYIAVLLVQHSVFAVTLQLNRTPSNNTVLSGSSILLTCSLNGSYDGYFEWRVFRGGEFGQQIYSTSGLTYHPDKRFPTDNYARYGIHGLNITSLTWQDGAIYLCEFLSAGITATANVIVIDEVTASFTASTLVNTTSTPSSMVHLVCSVSFGGPQFPSTDSTVSDQFPRLRMTFGSDLVFDSSSTRANYLPGSPGVAKHVVTATVNRKLFAADNGKVLTCTVSTKDPVFTMDNRTTVLITERVRNVSIVTRQSAYAVRDVITCSAHGFPVPRVYWRPLSTPTPFKVHKVEGSNLTVTSDMIGSNVWECVAVNSENEAVSNISFQVTALASSDQNLLMAQEPDRQLVGAANTASNSGSNVGLAIGLAIGLLALVAIGILIALLLVKRRNRFAQDVNGKPVAVSSIYSYTTVKSESSEMTPRQGMTPQHSIAPAVTSASGVMYQPRPASLHRSRPPSVLDRSGRGDLGLGIFRIDQNDQNANGVDSLYPRDWPHGSTDTDGRPLMNDVDQVPPYVVRRSRTPSVCLDEMIQSPTGSLVAGGFADISGRLDGTIGRLSRTSSLNRSKDLVTSYPPRRHSTVILEEDDTEKMLNGVQYPVATTVGRPASGAYRPAVAAKSAAVAEMGRALKRASANNSEQSSTRSSSMVNYSEMATVI